MRLMVFLIYLLLPLTALAVKGTYVEDHDHESNCKMTFYVKKEGKILTGTCTGSFIGKKTFITAEHCYEDIQENAALVNSKEVTQPSFFTCPGSDQKYTITQTFPMKESRINDQQDIAIVKVAEEVPLKAMGIPDSEFQLEEALKDYKNCYISGYGLDNEEKYGVLKTARLTQVDNKPLDLFSSGSPYRVRLRENYADHGDSGGPLYCETPEGTILIGVVHGGVTGINFSDIEKISKITDWVKYIRDNDVQNQDMFHQLVRNDDMCKSLGNCTAALKKVNELTTEIGDIVDKLTQKSAHMRIRILHGEEQSEGTVKDVWKEMYDFWEKYDCYNKIYP